MASARNIVTTTELHLSASEVNALITVLARVGGSPKGNRGSTERVLNALVGVTKGSWLLVENASHYLDGVLNFREGY